MTEQIKQRQPLIELKDVTKTYHDAREKMFLPYQILI